MGAVAGQHRGVDAGAGRSHVRTTGWRAAFVTGWALGVGYFALTMHWIVEPFLIDVARHGWMAPFALFFMAIGMALFWGAGLAIARAIAPRGVPLLLALAAVWTAAEMLRSLVLTGLPWVVLGQIWIDTPLAQLAAMTGPHGLTLLALGLAATLAGIGWRVWLAAPVLALALAGGWLLLDPGPVAAPAPDAAVVRLVQPNAAQDEKWDPVMIGVFYNRLLSLTERPSEDGSVPDLVVWPETAVPWLLEHSADILADVSEAAHGAPVVLGIQRRDDGRYYNSLALVERGGVVTALYDKAHLVPFGEYIPFGEVLARFGIHGLAASEGGGYTAGTWPHVIGLPGIGTALPLICYEGIFAEEINAAPVRPRLLLLITNDAWFGQYAGPQQHAAQARLRAIEQGVPMVRVANTGISAMIDGRGRIVDSLALGVAGAIDVALPADLGPTPYSRFGEGPVAGLLLAMAAAAMLAGRRFPIDPGARDA